MLFIKEYLSNRLKKVMFVECDYVDLSTAIQNIVHITALNLYIVIILGKEIMDYLKIRPTLINIIQVR